MPFSTTNQTYPFRGSWNEVAAVYGVMNESRQMIYIGETDNLKRRMAEHQSDTAHCMHRYGPTWVWAEVITTGEAARRRRETQLIAEYAPPCNS